jgi:hypothetical protein
MVELFGSRSRVSIMLLKIIHVLLLDTSQNATCVSQMPFEDVRKFKEYLQLEGSLLRNIFFLNYGISY